MGPEKQTDGSGLGKGKPGCCREERKSAESGVMGTRGEHTCKSGIPILKSRCLETALRSVLPSPTASPAPAVNHQHAQACAFLQATVSISPPTGHPPTPRPPQCAEPRSAYSKPEYIARLNNMFLTCYGLNVCSPCKIYAELLPPRTCECGLVQK